ncbi:MAG: M48 family metalloprotease [Planctomycetales bacterium]|nr:M48 family metalloprotease [Planctomycetales bacterium]
MLELNTIDLSSFALRLTISLIQLLWQGSLIALVAWFATRIPRRSSARTRHLIHFTALLLMALCVPITFAWVSTRTAMLAPTRPTSPHAPNASAAFSTSPSGSDLAAGDSDVAAPHALRISDAVAALSQPGAAAAGGAAAQGDNETAMASAATPTAGLWGRDYIELLRPWAPLVATAYLAGVALLLTRLGQGIRGGQRLAEHAEEVMDDDFLQRLEVEARRLGLKLLPPIRWCAEVSVPVVVGVLRPLVLMPPIATSGLSSQQLLTVIAHELAHIRRHDLALNLLQRWLEALLCFHPAAWWLSRQISREREEACDELVLQAGYGRATYADALVRMAELSLSQRGAAPPVAALSAAGAKPSELKRRILRVLGDEKAARPRASRLGLMLAAFAALLVLGAPAMQFNVVRQSAYAQPPEPTGKEQQQTDKTMTFLRALRPDSTLEKLSARGREFAKADLAAGNRRILYFGTPWSAGKPLVDDDTGYRVEIASGCTVTGKFVEFVGAYNATMKEHFTATQAAATSPAPPAAEASRPSGDQPQENPFAMLDGEFHGNTIKLAFSPNGKRLAVMNGNPTRTMRVDRSSDVKQWRPTVDIFDVATAKKLVALDLSQLSDARLLQEPLSFIEVTAIAFAPDSEVIGVGTSLGQVLMFDVQTGKPTGKMPKSLDDEQGRLSDPKTPDVWKQQPRALGKVSHLAFSPDGAWIAVCGASFADWSAGLSRVSEGGIRGTAPGRLKIFDARTGALKHNPNGHSDMVVAVAFSPDSKRLASAGRWMDSFQQRAFGDGITIWDPVTGERLQRVDFQLKGWMTGIEYSPDGKRILASAIDFESGGDNRFGIVKMLSAETGAVMWERKASEWARSASFNPQQKAVLCVAGGKGTYMSDSDGSTLLLLSAGKEDDAPRIEDVAVSRQGHALAMVELKRAKGQVKLLRTGKLDEAPDKKLDEQPNEKPNEKPTAARESRDLHLQGDDVSVEKLEPLNDRDWDTVTLSPAKFTGAIIAALSQAQSIHELRLLGDDVGGHLPRLQSVRGLKSLELSGELTTDGLQALSELTALEALKLPTRSALTVTGARHLAKLTGLKSLRLYFVDADDASFSALAPLTKLEELDLSHTRVTDEGLRTLRSMPHLKRLSLTRYGRYQFPVAQLSDACIETLQLLQELEQLSISGHITDSGLRQLATLPRLKRLSILYTDISGAGLAALAKAKVEELTLEAHLLSALDVNSAAAKSLRQCPTIRHVHLVGQPDLDSEQLEQLLPGVSWSSSS